MKGRSLYLIILYILAGTACRAQEQMTFLDWEAIARDTMCPVYAEVVPLQTDYRANTYDVRVDYPTWTELSPRETALARKYDYLIGDSLHIDQYLGIGRGQGLLNYSFVPIIRRGKGYRKLVSARICIAPTPLPRAARATQATAGTASGRYADHSILASGTWRKIHITEDGIYRLTPSFLAGMGFRNPDKVRLYGYGGHQQPEALDADNDFDDLEEVPLFRAPGGDLLFWGNGLVRWEGVNRIFNAYATRATYFLTEGDARPDITTEDPYTGSVRQRINTTLKHALHEVDDYAWFRGGRNLVEANVFAGAQSRNYTFSGIRSLGNERLTVVFTGGSVTTPLTISANGETVTSGYIDAANSTLHQYYSERKFSNLNVSRHLPEGDTWRITLSTQVSGPVSSRVQGRLDYIALNYTAGLELQNGFVRFGDGYMGTGTGTGSSGGVTRRFSGPTCFHGIGGGENADVRVMRIGRRGRPAALLPTVQGEDGLECSVADGTEALVAFDPSYAFPSPTAGQAVQNQDLHASGPADMVIIVPASGKIDGQARRLAEAHEQTDGLRCLVVRADQIYNEFSSGTPDATAYRRFMKMLYDRGLDDGTAPRYLLLMGDCAWDNRMKSTTWRTYSPDNYLLCYQSENSYSDTQSYCWEDYFGMLDDGEGTSPEKDISDLAIGRFPVTTEAQAKVMVDKTISHMKRENAGEWHNRIIVMGDDGDANLHMTDANAVATRMEETAPDVDVRKVMWDNYTMVNQGLYNAYPEIHAYVERQLQEGAMMFNYTGHGTTYLMSHERVVTLEDMKAWKTTRAPLWYVAACVVAPFDSQTDNLGEAAVLNAGGAVAFIGTTRTVYSTPNLYLNRFFSQYLLSRDDNGKRRAVGEALRMAKGNMVTSSGGESNLPLNKLQFALLGDPALFFGAAEGKVVLDSINGVALSEATATLSGGSRVRLSGHIEREAGVVDETFRGLMSYRLYDALENITTRGNTSGDGAGPFTYTYRSKEINHGTDSVRDGRFSTTVLIPKDISYSDESGRLVFYAVNNDNSVEANGSSEDLLVGGAGGDPITDTEGPEMFIYLNDKDFMDGDAVPAKSIFMAELRDESGIQYNGNGIGHDLQLCIDGDPRKTYNLNSYYTADPGDYTHGKVIFNDMPELDEGAHFLSFRSWDMLNNTSAQTLRFIVGQGLEAEVLSLVLESDVVSGQTNFHIAYNYPGLECRFRIDIYSSTGAVLWRHETDTMGDNGIVTIPWDGRTGAGAAVDDGIYICRVTASHANGKKSHKEKKFVLRRNK